jgi:hypothetical protein
MVISGVYEQYPTSLPFLDQTIYSEAQTLSEPLTSEKWSFD